ncbi:MAG: response regulator [Cyanobacteria bacterium P01_G01_bin.19]
MSNKRILIIEDDPGIRTLTKFCLEMDNGWEISIADCGEDGLLKAKALSPDVMMLDLLLPDMSGIEVLNRLRSDRATAQIPIILFTANLLEVEIIERRYSNVVGIIHKPYDSLTLSRDILNILDRQCKLTSSHNY